MQPLGEGGTGETFLCKRKSNGVEEAVKIIRRPLPNALRELVTNEIILQASIGEAHVNVVKARSVILTESHICLVMDFVPGGTLTDLVHDRAMAKGKQEGLCIEEDEARFLFRVRLHCLLLPATRLSAYDVWDDTTSHPSSTYSAYHRHMAPHVPNLSSCILLRCTWRPCTAPSLTITRAEVRGGVHMYLGEALQRL